MYDYNQTYALHRKVKKKKYIYIYITYLLIILIRIMLEIQTILQTVNIVNNC